MSAAAYKSEVNKICAVNNAKIAALPTKTATSAPGLTKAYSIAESTLSEVKGITAPSSLSASVDSWLNIVRQESAIATTLVNDLKAGKTADLQSLLDKTGSLETKGSDAATSLGLTSCAVTVQPSGH
jgi:hypothetical protein